MKKTKSRNCIIDLLSQSEVPMSAKDIFDNLKDQNITLSTIYRSLDSFYKEKLIGKMDNKEGISLYFLFKEEHSHFLECRNCHQKIKLDFCPFHELKETVQNEKGFEIDEDSLILYGTCKDCKNKV